MPAVNFEIFPDILRLNFNSDILGLMVLQNKRLVVQIRKEALLEIANYFLDELQFRFIIASGMNTDHGYDIIYHFSDDSTAYIINLMISLDKKNPEVESMANLINAANWIEREIHELFGIKFINHPNLIPLISGENWEETEHPYAHPSRDNKKTSKP
ncbi:MAG: NADH-quinone oxidoreductase subunit C [Bacteroidales bacterium]|nr:NADH-quinone oxidoreductase subunit C [Bacteroidales bacterium]